MHEDIKNFITDIIDADLEKGLHKHVVTRFPPEPNGYLHIGHAKSICLNFGLAEQYGGRCHLRYDDTNPVTEETEYVRSIQEDVEWLGFTWDEHRYFASDYFDTMYQLATQLIRDGKAYVDSTPVDQIRELRGDVHTPGTPSPDRDRPVNENLRLFKEMREGRHPDGSHVLRAKIDMESPNMLMRDPLLYRVRHATHHRTGDDWPIYPMYDFAHCIEDAIEGVTHSLCTLEFENNRELYDWVLDNVDLPDRPRQYEFARLNLDYAITSKRKLKRLVEEGHVESWDDPRLPTISGLRRRGVTPESIRRFCELIGVARSNSSVDIDKLEFCVRDDLNHRAPRVMCVLDPLRVTLTDLGADEAITLDAEHWPHDVPRDGSREVPLTRNLVIERDDFMEEPTRDFRRLSPGAVVRLRYGPLVRCDEVVHDADGNVSALRCSMIPDTIGNDAPDDVRVLGVIHWVSEDRGVPADVRIYDRLFKVPDPQADPDVDFVEHLNPASLVIPKGAILEPAAAQTEPGTHVQFERHGYYFVDPVATEAVGHPVFNRTVTLRDSWGGANDASAADEEKRRREREEAKRLHKEAQRLASRNADSHTERDDRRDADPELMATYRRFIDDLDLDPSDADILAGDVDIARWFDAVVIAGASSKDAAKWVVNDVLRLRKDTPLDELSFGPAALADLIGAVSSDRITSRAANEIFEKLAEQGNTVDHWVDTLGLEKVADEGAIDALVNAVVAKHPDEVARLQGGEMKLMGFFIGAVVRESGGSADPGAVKDAILKLARQ